MNKIAVGPEAKDVIDIDAPVEVNLAKIAHAKGADIENLTVIILDRPRHEQLIAQVRKTGARICLIPDGDVAAALMTSTPGTGIDVLLGIGGTPEGILAATALRCAGGAIMGKLYPRNEREIEQGKKLGYDLNRVLTTEDLVSSEDIFFAATGITSGYLLEGVSYFQNGARTDSLVMRGVTGTVRRIIATHSLRKLDLISSIQY